MLRQAIWLLLLVCLPRWAAAQWRLGPRGGVGFPLLQEGVFRPTANGTSILGFHVGIDVEYQFGQPAGPDLSLGAYLARLGGEVLTSEAHHNGGTATLFSAYFYAFQCPLMVGYHGSLSQLPLYIAIGLEPAWGLWGKQKTAPDTPHKPIAWQEDMRRFNLSITFRTGVELPRWPVQIGIYMDYGLLDLTPGEGHLVSVAYGFSFAYLVPLVRTSPPHKPKQPVAQ